MKHIPHKILWFIHLVLTAVVGTLASCAIGKEVAKEDLPNRVRVKYGVPNASYHLYGKVTGLDKKTTSDTQVTLKGYKNRVIATTTVGPCGHYEIEASAWPTDSLNIVVTNESKQISDSVQVKAEFSETDGWNQIGKKQKVNIQIQK